MPTCGTALWMSLMLTNIKRISCAGSRFSCQLMCSSLGLLMGPYVRQRRINFKNDVKHFTETFSKRINSCVNTNFNKISRSCRQGIVIVETLRSFHTRWRLDKPIIIATLTYRNVNNLQATLHSIAVDTTAPPSDV